MKRVYVAFLMLSVLWIAGCKDDDNKTGFDPEVDITEDRGEAPGVNYTIEAGTKYVDVLYFVSNDIDTVADWHWRLSGVVSHVQEFFATNLQKYYGIEKTFELIRNENNPAYIRINLVKGTRPAAQYKPENDGIENVCDELIAYYKSNPAAKTSHQHIVIVPEEIVAGFMNKSLSIDTDVENEFFSIWGCDHEKLNMKYFRYGLYRVRHLQALGSILRSTGSMFGLYANRSNALETFTALMGGSLTYANDPEIFRLTEADALMLDRHEAFNPRSTEVMYDAEPDPEKIMMTGFNVEAQTNQFLITATFMTDKPVAAFFVANDPWRSIMTEPQDSLGFADEETDKDPGIDTGSDATLFAAYSLNEIVLPNGYMYEAVTSIPVSSFADAYKMPLLGNDYAKAEFSTYILFKNGFSYPVINTGKEYYNDADLRPHRFRFQYYYVDNKAYIPYWNVTPKATDKWTVETGSTDGTDAAAAFDLNLTTSWSAPFDREDPDRPTIKLNLNEWVHINGVRINAGSLPDKAKKVSVIVGAYDWDIEAVKDEEIAGNAYLVGEEVMYHYFDFKKNNCRTITIRVEDSNGDVSTSIAEIGLY